MGALKNSSSSESSRPRPAGWRMARSDEMADSIGERVEPAPKVVGAPILCALLSVNMS
jgi:hypothetical protein